jgi:HSP20 family protein
MFCEYSDESGLRFKPIGGAIMKKTTELETKQTTAIQPANGPMEKAEPTPAFVEIERMLERFTEITKDIAGKAYEFFRDRGGEWGREVEDWFKAESEILRPVPVEITEAGDNVLVSAAVPGFKPEEIEVSVKGETLIISGATEASAEKKDANTITREWNSNRFYRQLMLPSPVMEDKVTAKLTNGMLELTLPKATAQEATKVAVASA